MFLKTLCQGLTAACGCALTPKDDPASSEALGSLYLSFPELTTVYTHQLICEMTSSSPCSQCLAYKGCDKMFPD